jgi:predicted porin
LSFHFLDGDGDKLMIGEIMKTKLSLAALLAGGMMVATSGSASAADLGGDCCADLEERVATLEATTARKGNRKVSLKISGWVNKAILIWDDGNDSDAYVVDSTYASTRIRFTGGAKINHEWSAGYRIEIETLTDRTFEVSQASDDNGGGERLRIRDSNMFIKSKSLGKLTWGFGSSPTDNLTFSSNVGGFSSITSGAQADFLGNSSFTVNGIRLFLLSGSLQSASFFESSFLTNIVRYDSPTIGGFTISASWGEDDFYDVAIKTTQKFGDFTFKASAGYRVFEGDDTTGSARGIKKEENLLANFGLMHNPTGLFIHGQYSGFEYDTSIAANDPDDTYGWHLQGGIKQRWNSLGKTTLWGGYTEINNGYARATTAQIAAGTDTELSKVQLGLIQEIDAAAMHLYITYEHQEFDISNQAAIDDIDMVLMGGVIKF